jgi:hypothetical protein
VSKAKRASRALLVLMGKQEFRAKQGLMEPPEWLVQQVSKEILVSKAQQEFRATQVSKEILGFKEIQVFKVTLV